MRTRLFVSLNATSPNLRANVPSAADGLSAGDVMCTEFADSRQLDGTWRAFLSGTTSAPARMIGNGPWVNTLDGGLFFLNRAALTLGLSPPDAGLGFEDGTSASGTRIFWSGTSGLGQPTADRCSDWSSSLGNGTTGATGPFGGLSWTYQTEACTGARRLLCVEQDLPPLRLSPRPTTPRRLFFTSLFTNGNIGGVAGADTFCTNVANARGLAGQWTAALSGGPAERPIDRISGEGPFTLVDGGVVFRNKAAFSVWAPLTSTLTDELGVPVTSGSFWTGSGPRGGPGANCNGWTSTVSVLGLVGDTAGWGFPNSDRSCTGMYRLLCVER